LKAGGALLVVGVPTMGRISSMGVVKGGVSGLAAPPPT
jgi:hypothetical protein